MSEPVYTPQPDVSPPSFDQVDRAAGRIRLQLEAAQQTPTDAYNEARRTGPVGVPPVAVAQSPDLFEPSHITKAMSAIQDRPGLRNQFARDPDMTNSIGVERIPTVAEAWDQLRTWPEVAAKTASAAGEGVAATTLSYESGARGALDMTDALFGTSLSGWENRSRINELLDREQRLQQSTEDLPLATRWLAGGIGQLPNAAVGMGARVAGLSTVGIPGVGPFIAPVAAIALPMVAAGMPEGAGWYNQTMKADPTMDRKAAAAMGFGIWAINGALELVPIDVGLNTLKGEAARTATKLLADREFRELALHGFGRLLTQTGAEGMTETLQELAPIVADHVGRWAQGKITADEMMRGIFSTESLARAGAAGLKGAEYSILPGGGEVVIGALGQKVKVEKANETRKFFEAIDSQSKNSADVIASAPDKYKQLMDSAAEEGGAIEAVWVDPAALRKVYGEKTGAWQTLLKAIPLLEEKVGLAEMTNGKVSFSPGEFATYIAGSSEFDGLADHFSLREDQPSLSESRALGSADNVGDIMAKMQALTGGISPSPNQTEADRTLEKDFANQISSVFEEKLTAVAKPVREKSAVIFARMVSRISEMDQQDPLDLMSSILGRLGIEQRPNLDTPAEQARSQAMAGGEAQILKSNGRLTLSNSSGQTDHSALDHAITDELFEVNLSHEERIYLKNSRYAYELGKSGAEAPEWLERGEPWGVDLQIEFFYAGKEGREAPTMVMASRLGEIPASRQSTDYRDHRNLHAVSVLSVDGFDSGTDGTFALFNGNRPLIRLAGWLIERLGTDGERLLVGAKNITSLIREPANQTTTHRSKNASATRGQLVVDRVLQKFLLQISEENVTDATLIHELAHLTLELVLDVAEGTNASAEIQGYRDEVLAFLGAKDRAGISGPMHEKWAESWEVYMREGKAPTEELQGLFSWFRSRLLKVYESLRGRLVNADKDLAFVPLFDRLLATDHEIRSAAMRNDVVTAFAGTETFDGLTPTESARIVKLISEIRDDERAKLETVIAREQDREMAAQRSELRDRIAAEVMARPEQRLRYWLRKGLEWSTGEPLTTISTGKLRDDEVDDLMNMPGSNKLLPAGTHAKDGALAPAAVATTFGYDSPEEMLNALAAADKPETIITRLVAEEAERLGLIATPADRQAMAAEALAGPQRDRLYEMERRIAQRLKAQAGEARAPAERALAGEAAPSVLDVEASLATAIGNLKAAVADKADPATIDAMQIEVTRARGVAEAAKVAREDQRKQSENARRLPSKIPTQVFRESAKRVIDTTLVRELKHQVASWKLRRASASRAKIMAAVKRDWDEYVRQVDAEQLSNALFEQGGEATLTLEKQRRYLISMRKKGSRSRERLGKHANDVDDSGRVTNYLDVIDSLLATVNLKAISDRRLDASVSIEGFAEKLKHEKGIVIPLPPWVIDLRTRPSWKTMTVEQIGDLYVAIRALEVNGLEMAKKAESGAAAFESNVTSEMEAELASRAATPIGGDTVFQPTPGNKRRAKLAGIGMSLISINTIANYIDRLNPEGAFHRYVVHPLQKASQREEAIKKEISRRINAAWEKYSPLERRQFYTDRIEIKSIGQSMTKDAIMAVAAQMGNEHGRAAVRDAKVFGFADKQVAEILSHITAKDRAFLIECAETIDSLWPEAEAVAKRMNGEAAPKVTGMPWQLPDGTWMPGFYFPLKFNSKLSEIAADNAGRALAQPIVAANGGSIMTKAGAMNARKETSGGHTIRPEFMSVMTEHLNEMAKEIAWRETLVMVHKRVKLARAEIVRVLGVETYNQFRPYLARLGSIRNTGELNQGWLNQIAGRARGGLGAMAMAYRATSALIQLSGFLPAVHRVGAANVFAGYSSLYLTGNPVERVHALREQLTALQQRAEKFDRDAQATFLRLTPLDVKRPLASLDVIRAYSMHFGFWLLGAVDTYTASAVAMGAMRQALNGEVVGIEAGDIEAAQRYANAIIKETQGSGEEVDRPAIMSGDNMQQLMTTMMTYSATQLNQLVLSGALARENSKEAREAKAAGRKLPVVPRNEPRFLAFYLYTFVMAPIMDEILRGLISAGDPDPPDFEAWLKRLMGKIAFGPLGGIPIARETEGIFQGYGGGDTPITDMFKVYTNVAKQTGAVVMGDGDPGKLAKSYAEFGAYELALPTKAMWSAAEVMAQEPIGRHKRN